MSVTDRNFPAASKVSCCWPPGVLTIQPPPVRAVSDENTPGGDAYVPSALRVYTVSEPSSARNTTEPSVAPGFGNTFASYSKLHPAPISDTELSLELYDRTSWVLMTYELDSAASAACWVNAPVAVLTPTPRTAGRASSRPLLPVPRSPRTCAAGRSGGVGRLRGFDAGEKSDTGPVVPSVAVNVTVTTYDVPGSRPQLSALFASVKQ